MPRNLILITADAWRADFADTFEGVRLLPSLDRVRDRTARVTDLRANAPWTTPAIVSMMSGYVPQRHGVHHAWNTPHPQLPSTFKQLGDAGWHVPSLCYLSRVNNYHHLGFDPQSAPTDSDPQRLIDAIAHTPEPFALWFHYKWTHLPYWASPQARAAFDIDRDAIPQHLWDSVCTGFVVPHYAHTLHPEDRALTRRLYAAGVLDLDAWLTRVLDALDLRTLDLPTTVALTSDHGDELLEHGHVGHASTAHRATLYDEVLRIPLFVIDPRVAASRTLNLGAQGVDLHPTLLELMGLALPESIPCDGRSMAAALLGDDRAADALAQTPRPFLAHSARMGYQTPDTHHGHALSGLVEDHVKTVHTRFGPNTRFDTFDLARDPHEHAPLAQDDPRAVAGRARLRALETRAAATPHPAASSHPNDNGA